MSCTYILDIRSKVSEQIDSANDAKLSSSTATLSFDAHHRGILLNIRTYLIAHRSHVGQATLLECGFEEMRHLPHSLYLAASY